MDSIYFPDGFHTVFRVESIWNPYGMSSWNHNSTLIPYHFQGGIQMDSIWNVHGIIIPHLKFETLKTFSYW
jgi:hypothetical protein